MTPIPVTAERLLHWRRIDPATGCWLWTGHRTTAGYGVVYLQNDPPRRMYAHRASVLVFHGKSPEGWLVCHHCDNPQCFNPEHLYLGDKRTNAADMVARGRARPPRKLTVEQQAAVQRRALDGERHRALAKEFGISVGHVAWLRHRGIETPTMRLCAGCGEMMHGAHGRRKYCSRSCGNRHRRSGVIANWDGQTIPAEIQIARARTELARRPRALGDA